MCGKGGIYMSKSKNPRFAILALILTIQTGVIANATCIRIPSWFNRSFKQSYRLRQCGVQQSE